jgi:tRNA threonylcarbamoyladenosine biosynthesis protein TsaE
VSYHPEFCHQDVFFIMQVYNTNSSEETQNIAEEFVRHLQPGDVICLYGDLGAGKTTFVQGLAKAFGLEKRIISPTFVIIRSYQMIKSSFYHVDLYRLREEEDIEGTGLLEILNKKDSIVAIEWSEKMGSLLPKNRWEVRLEHGDGDKRKITIERK